MATYEIEFLLTSGTVCEVGVGEWFNGKTAAFKVADLGSNPCSPAKWLVKCIYE